MKNKKILDQKWIKSIPKIINANGCWIPTKLKGELNGYVRIKANGVRYLLHRLSMCIKYDIDYYDNKVETRHSKGCDTRCFYSEHLKPGSQLENKRDKAEHKFGDLCARCGGAYTYRKTLRDFIPRIERRCMSCEANNQRSRRLKIKLDVKIKLG